MPQSRSFQWGPVMGALVVGAAAVGLIGWRLNVQAIAHQIRQKHTALKKLAITKGLPPNQDVMDYLTARQTALEQRYHHWVETIAAPPVAEAASADPQLYFQERVHEIQRSLEHLSAARGIAVPEQLGFPKELPPSDTVPRLLVQLSLLQEAAGLVLEQGVGALASLKIEDPEAVPEEEAEGPFLMRLPVRVRLTGSLEQLMKILGALERVSPLIEVSALRMVPAGLSASAAKIQPKDTEPSAEGSPPSRAALEMIPSRPVSDQLDVELALSRYLVLAPSPESSPPLDEPEDSGQRKNASQPSPRASRQMPQTSKHIPAGRGNRPAGSEQ